MTTLSHVIPPALHAETLRMREQIDPATGEIYTYRAIAAWLAREHGIECSHMSVIRLEGRVHKRGEALAVQALRAELRDVVGPLIERVSDATEKLSTLCEKETRTDRLASGLRALTASLDTFAKLGGVAAPMAVDVTSDGKPIAAMSTDELVAHVAALRARIEGPQQG